VKKYDGTTKIMIAAASCLCIAAAVLGAVCAAGKIKADRAEEMLLVQRETLEQLEASAEDMRSELEGLTEDSGQEGEIYRTWLRELKELQSILEN